MSAMLLQLRQEVDTSPLSEAVRTFIKRKKMKFNEVAEAVGLGQSGLSNRLTKTSPLSLRSPKDLELVNEIAKFIGVPYQEVIDLSHEFAKGDSTDHDIDVVSVLLDTLEGTSASPESKGRARRAILRMLNLEQSPE